MAIKASANVRQDLINQNDDGTMDREWFIRCVLIWMSEDDVRAMVDGMPDFEGMAEVYDWHNDEDDEYDGQPDEAQEWYNFDPDC